MRRSSFGLGSITLFLGVVGCLVAGPAPAQTIAEWQTTMGMFRCELREDLVPITAGNFIDLTNARFYDGCIFHRVIDNFVIQDGDPTGTGEGGPGYTIPDEFHPSLTHNEPGVLSMANAGPNTGGSQYFITLTPQPHLNGLHAVFGKVVVGMDVVQAIGDVPTDTNDRPIVPVVIDSLRILGTVYPHLQLDLLSIRDDPANSDGDGVLNPLESGLVTLRMANWAGWADAFSITGTMTCADSRVQILQGTAEFGSLASGDSTDNSTSPFRLAVTANEAFSATLHVEVVANAGMPYPYTTSLDIPMAVSLDMAGWPQSVGALSSPLIIDIGGDGAAELVFGDQDGWVHAYHADGAGEIEGFPVALGGTIRSALAAGDLDGDGRWELVANRRTPNATVVLDDTGVILHEHLTAEYSMANPAIADVDGNGTCEIISVSMNTGSILVMAPDGTTLPGFPVAIGAAVRSSPAVGDIDRDGHAEVVVVSSAGGGSIHAVSTNDGVEILGWPVTIGSESVNGPMIADLDGDGGPEVVVGTDGGVVRAYNRDGSVRFTAQSTAAVKTSVVPGDLDGDGILELVFVANDGRVHALDAQGRAIPGFPVPTTGACRSTPVLADLNGNGTADIVFANTNGYVYVIDVNDDVVAPFPLNIGASVVEGVCIGHLDDDADAEIAAVSGLRCCVIDTKRAARIVWPCFKGSPQRTGNTADIPTASPGGQGGAILPSLVWLSPPFPNPSSGAVKFRFAVPQTMRVALGVYDAQGRRVATVLDRRTEAGLHTVIWDGRSDAGSPCRAGLYVCTLTAGDRKATRRLVMVR